MQLDRHALLFDLLSPSELVGQQSVHVWWAAFPMCTSGSLTAMG